MKALIIDDNSLVNKTLTGILEREGYSVASVENGVEALERVYDIVPDVILLDIILPRMDGFELCKELKKDNVVRDIPIIMISSKTDSKDLKQALELGAFDYIKKPIDAIEVVARVQSALRFKEYQDRLKEMATKDSLTGVYNHALLIDLLEKEIEKKRRSKGSVAFCMIDIDFFKKVNDNFGHMSGDIVLKKLAEILTSILRSSDIIGRYGGEEFGIVLPDLDIENTYKLCERIRQTLEEYIFDIKGQRLRVTISLGICHQAENVTMDSSEMIRTADGALYRAKHNGRNRVEM